MGTNEFPRGHTGYSATTAGGLEYVIGIDLGTSAVKASLMNENGDPCGFAQEGYPTIGLKSGRCEQKPSDWVDAIVRAAGKLAPNIEGRVKCIALSAQMPTMVMLGGEGMRPLANAILWCDNRAERFGKELLDIWGAQDYYMRTGIILDGRYILPMYLWAAAHLPEFAESPPRRVLSAKDYIAYWMTGEYVTDPSTASGYGIYSLAESDWDAALCDKIGFERPLLPKIKPSTDIAGPLKKDIAALLGLEAGIPVINGCADSVCGALSMGAYKAGTLCQIWGTSTALLAMTDKYKMSPTGKYFITPMAMEGTYGYEADLLSTGVSVKWFKELVGGRSRDISFYGAKADAGSDGLLFYPYLSGGEQGVLWEPGLRGGLLGLSEKHTAAHIARAIQEGICFEVKRCLAAFSAGGFRAKRILCTGPASADAFFMQMMADVLGLSCAVSANTQGSSSGAAWLAGAAAGFWTLEDESSAAKNRSAVYTPSKDSGIYPGVYKKYLANTDKMKISGRKNR